MESHYLEIRRQRKGIGADCQEVRFGIAFAIYTDTAQMWYNSPSFNSLFDIGFLAEGTFVPGSE